MKLLRWIDRNPHYLPPSVFLLGIVAGTAYVKISGSSIFFALGPSGKEALYSSLAGNSGSLLGFVLAAVAVLAALSPRFRDANSDQGREKRLARARERLVLQLLSTGMFLLITLAIASTAIALDREESGGDPFAIICLSASGASIVGLLNGGVGFALAVLERTR